MTKRAFWLTVLALAIPGAISAQSIHPFYKDDDVVFRQEMLGKWTVGGEVVLEFRDLGKKTYGITLYADKNTAIYFRAHLFCVDERCFLDGQVAGMKLPDEAEEKNVGTSGATKELGKEFELDKTDFLLNRAHGLILMTFAGDSNEFSAALWEESWLPQMEANDKLKVAHTKDEVGRVLITAESDALREWLKEVPKEAFAKPELLRRVTNEVEQSANLDTKDAEREELSGRK